MSPAGPAGGDARAGRERGEPPAAVVPDEARPAFDVDEALAEIPGGLEMAQELASLFAEEYASVSELMRRGLAAGDLEPVRRGAHMLKSSAGIFAAHAAVEAAERLERIAVGRDIAAATTAMADFEREAGRLMAALARHFPADG